MRAQSMAQPNVSDPVTERFQSAFVEDLKEIARRKQEQKEQETWTNAIRLNRLRNLWRHSSSPRSTA